MDITLQRILSLLPKKEDGSFVRGAKKDFATSIGYDSGDIVSMWIKGTSTSYYGKIHEIAAKYHVSVEYLTGETDNPNIEKSPATAKSAEDFMKVYELLTPDRQAQLREKMADLLKEQLQG